MNRSNSVYIWRVALKLEVEQFAQLMGAAPTTVRQWERQPVPKMNERHAQLFNALKGAVKPSEIAQAHTLGDVFIERGRIAFWKEVARLYAVRLERRVLAAAGQPIAASLEECEVRSAESGVQEKAGAA